MSTAQKAGKQQVAHSKFKEAVDAAPRAGDPESAGIALLSMSEELGDHLSLGELVLRYEGDLIRRALETSGGSVTRAARLLGITHQGLAFILNGRHRNLLSVRTPVRPRRRSIIRYR